VKNNQKKVYQIFGDKKKSRTFAPVLKERQTKKSSLKDLHIN
jgi:hypothetical protein